VPTPAHRHRFSRPPPELGQQACGVDSIRSSTSAGSGHPTSSMSAADLLAVLVEPAPPLWTGTLRTHAGNDHPHLLQGDTRHPCCTRSTRRFGVVSDEGADDRFTRRFGSRLEGHPTPILPWVDVATGSLGQGPAPTASAFALAGKYLDELPYRVLGAVR